MNNEDNPGGQRAAARGQSEVVKPTPPGWVDTPGGQHALIADAPAENVRLLLDAVAEVTRGR